MGDWGVVRKACCPQIYLRSHATYRAIPKKGLGLLRGQHNGREQYALDRTTASP